MPFRLLLSLDLGMSTRLDLPPLPMISVHPSYMHLSGINRTSPYMHGNLHVFLNPHISPSCRPSATKLLGEDEDPPSNEDPIYFQDANFQVHLTSSESQTAVLAELASEEVKLIIPLNDLARDSAIIPTSEEKTLLNALESLDDLDGATNLQPSAGLEGIIEGEYDVLGIEDVDGLTPEEVAELMPNQDEARGSFWMTLMDEARRPVLVSAACAAAFMLIFLCTVTALYAMDFIKGNLFNSRDLYNVLPGAEKGELGAPQGRVGVKEKKLILDSPEEKEEVFNEKDDVEAGNTPQPVSSTETPLPPPYREAGMKNPDDSSEDAPGAKHDDPGFLPLPDHQQPSSAPPRRSMNPQSRERTSTNLPPSWSVRASESQPLSIPGAYVFDPLPLPFSESTTETGGVDRRPYSDRNPEIDIALAMQLRPGLGEGADAAWLVRFLMGIFGWVTVVVSGNGR
jgi:hypothetical protein